MHWFRAIRDVTRKMPLLAYLIVFQLRHVGMTGFEPAAPCPPDRCATKLRHTPEVAPFRCSRADEGNRTPVTSVEDWRSAIELRPRGPG